MGDDGQSRDGTARSRPWYSEGLRFECQPDCGRCCSNHDGYAYVYLDGDDLQRLAEFFGIAPAEFRRRFTSLDDGYEVLTMESPHCPFLRGTRCTVYEARPTQCRTFPFWEEHLRGPETWDRTREFCPGIDRGPLHSLEFIRERLDERET